METESKKITPGFFDLIDQNGLAMKKYEEAKRLFLKSKSPVFSLNAFSFLWSRANSISAPLSQSDKLKCRPQAREEVVELKKKNKF